MELIPAKISELELELIPERLTGMGIGINSLFFGICKGLTTANSKHFIANRVRREFIPATRRNENILL